MAAAYCSYGVVTILYSGALLGALYDIPNIRYDGYRVLTNKPACGAMRGHGTVNVRFAFESQLDELAEAIGMDPATIREKQFIEAPAITVNGLRVQSYGLPECIEKVVERSEAGMNVRANCREGAVWDRMQPLCERRGELDYPLGHAALDGEHQNRSRRRRGGLHRRIGYRARLGHDGGANRGGSAGLRDGASESGGGGYGFDAD